MAFQGCSSEGSTGTKNICDIIDEIPEENLRHDTLVFDYTNRASYVSGGYYVDSNKGVWAKITFHALQTMTYDTLLFRGMPEPTTDVTVYTKEFFEKLNEVGLDYHHGNEDIIKKYTGRYPLYTPYYVRGLYTEAGRDYTIYMYYLTT